MKDIRNYLHFYIGCKIQIHHDISDCLTWQELDPMMLHCILIDNMPDRFKPILRPLSDMTEDEAKELESIGGGTEVFEKGNIIYSFDSHRTLWALKKGFDLFSLIESGLAIDKTKLPTNER